MDYLKHFAWQRVKSVPVLNPKTSAPMLLTVDTRHNPITGKWEAAISGGLLFSNDSATWPLLKPMILSAVISASCRQRREHPNRHQPGAPLP